MDAPARAWAGPRLAGLALLALGALALGGTFAIRSPTGWAVSGPRFFPLVIAIGLIACALAFLATTTVRPDVALAEKAAVEEADTHWPTVGLLGAALVAYAVLLSPLGFVIATTLFLPVGARVLGSTSPVRDALAGLGVGLAVYYLFSYQLGVGLPSGPLPF